MKRLFLSVFAAAAMVCAAPVLTPSRVDVGFQATAAPAFLDRNTIVGEPVVIEIRKATAQSLKMRSCNADWKASGGKGRAAYKSFMATCLKRPVPAAPS